MSKQRTQRSDDSEKDPLLTSADVSRLFMVAQSTVWRWVNEGKIPSIRLPSNLKRVRLSDVQRVLGEVASQQISR